MKKLLLTIFTIISFCVFSTAQENSQSQIESSAVEESSSEMNISESTGTEEAKPQKDFQNHLIPVLGFQALQIEEKDFILSPSINLQFMRTKSKGVESAQPDLLVIGGGYSQNYYTCGIGPDRIKSLHSVNLLASLGWGKHSFTGMLASGGEIPFSSPKTLTGGLMYTCQLVNTENIKFSLGGGIIVADTGIKIKDFPIYCFPLPLFSFTYANKIVSATASVMGAPSLQLILFPKSMFRLKGSCGIAGFKSIRDLAFDCALVYYPLFNSVLKEALSISAGVKNTHSSTILRDKTKIGYQYYCAYGEINASFITLACGYNFDGKVLIDDEVKGDMYKGIFASIKAMYMF